MYAGNKSVCTPIYPNAEVTKCMSGCIAIGRNDKFGQCYFRAVTVDPDVTAAELERLRTRVRELEEASVY